MGIKYSAAPLEKLKVDPETKDKANLVVAMLENQEVRQTRTNRRLEITYNFGFQPGSVCALNDSMVEIICVALILILQLVEEVEEIESECCGRAFDCRREPTGMEELNTSGGRAVTITVLDDETVDPGKVKHHEVAKGGWLRAYVTDGVSNLKNEAERRKGAILKEAAIPFLCVRQ